MNKTEAVKLNELLDYLAGRPPAGYAKPLASTREAAIDAAAWLADRANRALSAGWTGEQFRTALGRLHGAQVGSDEARRQLLAGEVDAWRLVPYGERPAYERKVSGAVWRVWLSHGRHGRGWYIGLARGGPVELLAVDAPLNTTEGIQGAADWWIQQHASTWPPLPRDVGQRDRAVLAYAKQPADVRHNLDVGDTGYGTLDPAGEDYFPDQPDRDDAADRAARFEDLAASTWPPLTTGGQRATGADVAAYESASGRSELGDELGDEPGDHPDPAGGAT